MKHNILLIAIMLAAISWLLPQRAWATLDVAGNLTQPFTIETTPATNSYIRFRRDWGSSGSTKVTINLQYRKQENGGAWGDWTTIATASTTTIAQLYGNSIPLTAGTTYKIQFRGVNSSGFSTATVNGTGTSNNYNITLESSSYTWSATMYGNIMSLIVGYDTDNETAAQEALAAANEIKSDYCFAGLFYDNNSGSTYPPAINAENLIFPATYLRAGCYRNLFYQYDRSDASFKGGLNEGPCFLATNWNNLSGSHVNNTFLNVFNQCANLKSAHFSFTSCPTSDDFNSYSVYKTPGDCSICSTSSPTKTLYAPAGFNPSSCSIGNWNGGHTVWSYDPSAEPGGDEPGGGSSSAPASVNVYQAGTTDTTKILYDLPANAVDLGVGVAWATTDYDASTTSKFAAENKGNTGLTASGSSITPNVWYLYSEVSAPTDWRFPTRTECEKAFANGTSRNNLGTNNYRMRIESGISDEYIEIGAHGYVLYSNDWYYGTSYSWQMMNFPYVWISQNECFSLNSSTIEPEFVGCDATCMMTPRLVYDPTSFTTHTLTIHCGDKTYTYKCEHGQEVTVTAVPDEMQEFKWWSDDHSNTTATRTFTVNNDMEVEAVFKLDSSIPQHTATFRNWDGTELYQVDVAVGAMPVYAGSTPTKTDWFFNGWSPAISVMGDADVVYTATFRDFESAPANVNIYQGMTADTMKILYNLDPKTGADGKTYIPVDMGYGVAWADRNVGATSTTNVGTYFQWGSTKTTFTAGTSNSDCVAMGKSAVTLTDAQDAAYVNVGTRWKMPTSTEWSTFLNNTTQAGDGGTFRNKTDATQSIFLPASGYWISSEIDIPTARVYRSRNYSYSRSTAYGSICLHNNGGTYRVENRDRQTNNGYYFSQSYYAMPIRAIYVPSYSTCTLTVNVGTKKYRYICQSGQEVTVTANATVAGQVFDKWTEDNNTNATRTFTVTGNVAYTATFKEAPTGSTISIVADNTGYGSVDVATINNVPDDSPITVSSNTLTINNTTVTATVTESNTAQYTYSFTGWTDNSGNALPESVTADLAIRANFTQSKKQYTLTWNFNGGTTTEDYTNGLVEWGTPINAPTPTKDGCTFAGWDITPAATMPAATTTYTAQWTDCTISSLTLEDNREATYYNTFVDDYNGVDIETVTYNRTFAANTWSTVCLPFYVDANNLSGAGWTGKVFEFKHATGTADISEGLYLNFYPASEMEAGKGYLVYSQGAALEGGFEFYDVKIDTDADTESAITDLVGYNDGQGTITLVGTLRQGTLTSNTRSQMALKDNKVWYPGSGTTTIRAYRGFFKDSSGSPIPPRVHIVVEGEVVTDLEVMDNGELRMENDNVRKYMDNGVLIIERNGIRYDAQGKRIEN